MDRSQPAEDQPVPDGGAIKVVRVREEIVLNQTNLPFKSENVADPLTELEADLALLFALAPRHIATAARLQ